MSQHNTFKQSLDAIVRALQTQKVKHRICKSILWVDELMCALQLWVTARAEQQASSMKECGTWRVLGD